MSVRFQNTLDTEEAVGTIPYEEPAEGSGDMFTHIVNPPSNKHIWLPGMSAQDVVDTARLTGQEVVALCGKRWVPKHDPEKHDACPTCMEVAAKIMQEMG